MYITLQYNQYIESKTCGTQLWCFQFVLKAVCSLQYFLSFRSFGSGAQTVPTSMCLLGLTFDATSATHLFVRAAADTLIFETALPYTRTIKALMAVDFTPLTDANILVLEAWESRHWHSWTSSCWGLKVFEASFAIPHTSSKTAACNPNLKLKKTKNTFLSTQVQHTNLDPEFLRLRGCKSCKRLRFGRRCNWVSNVFPLRLLNFETWWSLKVEEFQMLGFGFPLCISNSSFGPKWMPPMPRCSSLPAMNHQIVWAPNPKRC